MEIQRSRSVVVNKFGGYDCLSVENFPLPELDGRVEIKVEYGGVNFADLYTRQGLMLNKKLPFVLGMECTGTISANGKTETDLKVGQRVICYDYRGGMYSDVLRITPDKCFPIPEYVDSKIAAAIFVNYLTAYYALLGLGNLKQQEKVLIMSCAGGVGCAATQLAKTKNVQIFGTGSSEKKLLAEENGVNVFYSNESFKEDAKNEKFDLIIANESGSTFTFLQSILKPLGRIVLIGANNIITNEKKLSMITLFKAWWNMKHINPETLIINNQNVGGLHLGTLIESDSNSVKNTLNYIFELYKTGIITPKIHAVMPMSKIVEATKLLAERKNTGKVLLQMNEI